MKNKARSIASQFPMAESCERCGSTYFLNRHHEDYNKPKIFLTLCKKCHGLEGRKYQKSL